MRKLPRKSSVSSAKERAGSVHPEAWISLALAGATSVVAAGYLYATSRLQVPEMVDPVGPTSFPYLIGICLLLCVAGLLFEGVSKARIASSPEKDKDEKSAWDYLVSAAVIGWTLLYFLAFARAGFVLSTSIFLVGLTSVFHRGFGVVNLLVSIGFSVVSYLLFTRFFEVMLPPGPFFGGIL